MTDLSLKSRIQAINGLDRLWSPDQPLRVIPLPDDESINPFYKDGLRIWTAMGCSLSPGQNIKSVSVIGMILAALEEGKFADVEELVENTSGNTGLMLVACATYLGIKRVTLVVQRDLAVGKRDPLELSFGGELNFINPEGTLSGIETARRRGQQKGVLNLDQYGNIHNADLHEQYTGPQILSAVPDVSLYVGGVGTGGTTIGTVKFLRQHVQDMVSLGVFCAPGQKIPGVRDFERMKDITLPWRDWVDATVEIDTRQGYLATLWLIRIIQDMYGPSGGFALAGLLKFFHSCKATGKPFDLDRLRVKKGPNQGLINAVVMIPDTYRPYVDHFKSNLTAEQLNPRTSPPPASLLW